MVLAVSVNLRFGALHQIPVESIQQDLDGQAVQMATHLVQSLVWALRTAVVVRVGYERQESLAVTWESEQVARLRPQRHFISRVRRS